MGGAEQICAYRAYLAFAEGASGAFGGSACFFDGLCRGDGECVELGAGGMVWAYGALLMAGAQGGSAIGGCGGVGGVVFLGVGLMAIRAAMALAGKALFLVGVGVFIVGIAAMAMPFWGTVVRQRLYGWSLIWLGLMGYRSGGGAESRFG
jgi:hypothetical protein